jgi:uncharacterized protein (DUF362 family)
LISNKGLRHLRKGKIGKEFAMGYHSIVFVERLEKESPQVLTQMSRAVEALHLAEDFNKAKAILIKPNLTYPVYKKGVTTRKEFVELLIKVLRAINSGTMIYIGEGEGGYSSFSMTEAMQIMGFFEMEKMYSNVKIVNLSKMPSRTIELKVRGKPFVIDLPGPFFNEIDFSITCPLPKVHDMTRITLGFKNQWGCLPDAMRLKHHYVFNEIIPQICNSLKFRYAFLDGKYGLDKNGPMSGEAVDLDWFVASNSLGAFDLVVSKMMGMDWRKVKHLVEAQKQGLLPEISDVKLIGEIEPFNRQFVLKRTFWSYPALIAFGSKWLTQFVYLSRYSKVIHNIMYTFRPREIWKPSNQKNGRSIF